VLHRPVEYPVNFPLLPARTRSRPVDGVACDVRTHGENGGNMCSFRCKTAPPRPVSVCEYTAIDLFGLDRFVNDMLCSGITHVVPARAA